MGCFDSVYVACPRCSKKNEVQSKAGDCALESFDETNVPIGIASDINGERVICEECGMTFEVAIGAPSRCYVWGAVPRPTDDEDEDDG